jgi:trehalose 6-phosphate synthase
MRAALRFLLPLLVLLAIIAFAASEFMIRQAHRWAERDLSARARLVLASAREGLGGRLASKDRARARLILDEMVRDERLLGAEVCGSPAGAAIRTAAVPPELPCDRLPARPPGDPHDAVLSLPGGTVHVSVLPVADEAGQGLGDLVLVHDMSYLDRRAAETRKATFGAFALVGLLAAASTLLASRFSWLTWTAELRRLLATPFHPAGGGPSAAASPFQPVLSDVRDLVSRLAAEEASGAGGRWSPDRLRNVLRTRLHGEGVIVVANREPYIHERAADGSIRVVNPASGLVTALEPVMRACSGTWVAHGSGSADRETVDGHDRVRVPPGEESYALRRVWLSREEERGYYYGFANEGLWPLCHVAHTRPDFRASDWEQYRRVNARFADVVAEEASGPDPVVLVQDYHFALLPRMLRERLPRATILTFWHIPWPNAERFGICPWEREVLDGLLGSSIVGFHTQAHCNNFVESVDRYLESRIDRERQAIVMGGRETLVRPYPISIEWPSRWAQGLPDAARCRDEVRRELGIPADALLGVGVDRLDYTKGIVERLQAVERLLDRFPGYRGRFFFAQMAAPSRTLIETYRRLNDDVEGVAAAINSRFGNGGPGPILLMRRHHEPRDIFRAYRAADVCYVSSLHDGMNLVAKEFVSAREDLRGVLVLSRFTGAARELAEALVVNPYDLEEASSALAAALSMSPEEQEQRMRALRTMVAEFNVYRWAGRMLLDATRLRQRERLSVRLSDEWRSGEPRRSGEAGQA